MAIVKNINEEARQAWLSKTLLALPAGIRILDAGAGELKNRIHCQHLDYVSQDFAQYTGGGEEGLSSNPWNASQVDIVSDIVSIPQPDASFDAILCSEVLEHVPEPTHALDEFTRLLKPGGILILTAPFASNVHMAPYHFYSGFSKYWYQHHLEVRGFEIRELVANGDWSALLRQEITRLGGHERSRGRFTWPLGYVLGLLAVGYFAIRGKMSSDDDLACFGWHCVAVKNDRRHDNEAKA